MIASDHREAKRNSYLIRNVVFVAIGNLSSKIITFFLIPLYTHSLTTEEYGIIDLIITICTLAIPLFTLNISEAVMRFSLDKDADYDTITKIGMFITIAGVSIGTLVFPLINRVNNFAEITRILCSYIILSSINQLSLCDLRGKGLLLQFSIGNIINVALIFIFSVIFLIYYRIGIKGYLYSHCLAYLITSIYALIIGKGYKAFPTPIDYGKMKEMLKYSIVLIPNSFMWWIMNSSDHIMVTSMLSASSNGIYAISYKFPTLISSIMLIFNQAWCHSAIREEGSEDIDKYTNRIFKLISGIVIILGICMMTFIKPCLKIYVSAEYYVSWKYTPFLIIGYVFSTLGTFMSTTYSVHKDSMGYLMSGSFGAVLNIILNWMLIPTFGIHGAAIATGSSYIAVFVFRFFHIRKYFKYEILSKEFVLAVAMLFVSAVCMLCDKKWTHEIQLVLLVGCICVYKDIWLPYIIGIIKKSLRHS